jgi:hypothetical protein
MAQGRGSYLSAPDRRKAFRVVPRRSWLAPGADGTSAEGGAVGSDEGGVVNSAEGGMVERGERKEISGMS